MTRLTEAGYGKNRACADNRSRTRSGNIAENGRTADDLQRCAAGHIDRGDIGQVAAVDDQLALIDVCRAGVSAVALKRERSRAAFVQRQRAAAVADRRL